MDISQLANMPSIANFPLCAFSKDLVLVSTDNNSKSVLLEDSLRGNFYRVGQREYALLSGLDGGRSLSEARKLAQRKFVICISEGESLAIVSWAIQQRIVYLVNQRALGTNSSAAGSWLRCNPVSMRFPLLRPDRLVERLLPWTAWMYSPVAIGIWSMLVLLASLQVFSRRAQFQETAAEISPLDQWPLLAGCWLMLKMLHELSHALVCRKYGGKVREAGVIFVLLAPIAYVDVTSSWKFAKTWQRIFTSLAGMYAEIGVAAVATLIWSVTEPGSLKHVCFSLATMASLTTVLFNANPLMRLDGYYVLSDLTGQPNLYSRARCQVFDWISSYLFGQWSCSLSHRKQPLWIGLYGIAALFWRGIMVLTLLIAASVMFAGAGIILAAIAVCMWSISFASTTMRRLARWRRSGNAELWRSLFIRALLRGALPAIGLILLLFSHWPLPLVVPGLVEFAPAKIVRVECQGFVQHVLVEDGQAVHEGDILFKLENHQLRLEEEDLQLAIKQSQQQRRSLQLQGRIAESQAERRQEESLREQLAEKQRQVACLDVQAPADGTIIARNVQTLTGTYVTRGVALATVAATQQKQVRLSISQNHLAAIRHHLHQPTNLRTSDGKRFHAVISTIQPKASTVPVSLALCAPMGGPSAVRPLNATPDGDLGDYELLSPCFSAIVPLNSTQGELVHAGQLVGVSFLVKEETVFQHLYQAMADQLRHIISSKSIRP